MRGVGELEFSRPPKLGSQCGLGVSPSRAPGVDLGGEKDLCIHGSLLGEGLGERLTEQSQ
jgi:hypothetical protein